MEISIKRPCHENWDGMTPNEQGAFCGKCVKTVFDFTNKSLDEIKSFFTERAQEKICGRFEENQLAALSFDVFFEKFKRFEFTRRFAVILFFTFGMWLFGAPSVSAQNSIPVKGDVMLQEPVLNGNVKSCNKDSISRTQQIAPQRPVMGAATQITPPQTYKMGKIAPVKQEPVKQTPAKKESVKPAPLKKPVKKEALQKTAMRTTPKADIPMSEAVSTSPSSEQKK